MSFNVVNACWQAAQLEPEGAMISLLVFSGETATARWPPVSIAGATLVDPRCKVFLDNPDEAFRIGFRPPV